MPPFLGALGPALPDAFAESLHLHLIARVPALVVSGGGLGLQGQGNASALQLLIHGGEEGHHPADAQIGHRLIDNFLYLHRGETHVQRGGQHDFELVDALAAQQGRQNGQEPGAVVYGLHAFGEGHVHHLVKGKAGKAVHKFRVRLCQRRLASGLDATEIGLGFLGHLLSSFALGNEWSPIR